MKALSLLTLVLAFAFTRVLYAQEEIVLIVHKDEPVESLSQDQLKKMYLGKIQLWHEAKVRPAYIKGNGYNQLFFEEMIGMSYIRFQRHWLRKTFSGSGSAPEVFLFAEAMIEFVGKTPGAIGFIPASEAQRLERCKIVSLE